MSFKDDFLEALRSVKRDFFRDSEYASDNSQVEASAPTEENAAKPHEFTYSADAGAQTSAYDSGAVSQPAYSDDEVLDRFEQASAISDDDSDEVLDDDQSGLHSEPFRSFTPSAAPSLDDDEPGFVPPFATTIQGAPIVQEPRRAYEFAAQELYEDDKTVISRNTTIRGSLQTDDSVRMLGQILGDIECKSNVVIAGKVRGNTAAANAYIIDAQVDGNMLCDDSVNISNDAWILGNIRAQQAEIDGKIKGNIEIRHNISIGSTSSIIGNISADELEIKRGAFVNGQIIMYSPSRDVLDGFDNFGN